MKNKSIKKEIATIEELRKFVEVYIKPQVKAGITIGLCGELGAGKTTFVSQLISLLESSEQVSSPTFVLMHEYKIGELLIEHWDLYRLDQFPAELETAPSHKTMRIIEWADKFKTACDIEVDILINKDGKRTLDVTLYRQFSAILD
jgi:tRNA threonylcarbamoyl adenosine modification protein YjeE